MGKLEILTVCRTSESFWISRLASSCPVIPVSERTRKQEDRLWGVYRTCGDQGSGRDKRGFDTPRMHFHSQYGRIISA